MLLRIEDTDRARSTDPAVAAILDGLSWLGLDWDGEPISQHARQARHREIGEKLLETGNAYPCYATPQELTEMRANARANGLPPRYDGRWRDRPAQDAPNGVAPAIRLKAPREGVTIVRDQVQGNVTFANKDLDDLVLLRSDGSTTYMLAVVVDDHDMGVSHIIRGDDHLTNAARQQLIYAALGWSIPAMAHIPLIHGPDGAKLSKRHGALGAEAYREMGYLPQALRNYLVRLGWAHGDDEILSLAEMIDYFDLPGIGKAAARFDFAKLENLNGHYIRNTNDTELSDTLINQLPFLPVDGLPEKFTDDHRGKLIAAMPGLKERAKTLTELANSSRFLFAVRPLAYDEKAEHILADGGAQTVGNLAARLSEIADWSPEAIEAGVREFADAADLKLGKVAQPIRCALTGRTVSPGVFEVMAVLGRQESIARMQDAARAFTK